METISTRNEGWDALAEIGLPEILNALLSGQVVCLVGSESSLNERLLEKIRDALKEKWESRVLDRTMYETLLERVHLCSQVTDASEFTDAVIVSLSLSLVVQHNFSSNVIT